MKKIVNIVLTKSTRQYDRLYSYIVPDALTSAIEPGMRVLVPFGQSNRTVEAVILEVSAASTENETKLKEIKNIIDKEPIYDNTLLELCKWMRKRYICTFGDIFKVMTPPGISVKESTFIELLEDGITENENEEIIISFIKARNGRVNVQDIKNELPQKNLTKTLKTMENRGLIKITEGFEPSVRNKKIRVATLAVDPENVSADIENGSIKRIQQIRVLELLLDCDVISVQDLMSFCSVTVSVINTLVKKGYIEISEMEIQRTVETPNVKKTAPLVPNEEQELIIRSLSQKIREASFESVLLHGVTGSGKTEVYLQLISFCLELGKQAIVLVPEIALTPQMVERFRSRFGENVAVWHSRLSPGEKYDQWKLMLQGKINVVVGARSAVFAPFKKLGMIVVDEEHESSYKSEITPKYHARDVAVKRCSLSNAVLLCGSATPSIESYYNALTGKTKLYKMEKRANNMILPKVTVVDMRKELEAGNRSIFSELIKDELNRNLEIEEQTILFLNRRGHSSFMLCRDCGITLMCPNCNISLTYHQKDERLICHYCGYTIKTPKVCPKCGGPHIRQFGAGTQKVEEEVNKKFPEASVVRMDLDTTTGKNSHAKILGKFKDEGIDILVGTQMIAKGHDFPKVTLVGILAADGLLGAPDFRSSEKTFQLITQVSGRAGRAELEGRVVLQAYNVDDFSIKYASRHDYEGFFENEIAIRKKLHYPPFTNIGMVLLSGQIDKMVYNVANTVSKKLTEDFKQHDIDLAVLGPSRAPVSRINGKYRWRIIIKCDNMERMISILTTLHDGYYDKKNDGQVALSIEINPQNML